MKQRNKELIATGLIIIFAAVDILLYVSSEDQTPQEVEATTSHRNDAPISYNNSDSAEDSSNESSYVALNADKPESSSFEDSMDDLFHSIDSRKMISVTVPGKPADYEEQREYVRQEILRRKREKEEKGEIQDNQIPVEVLEKTFMLPGRERAEDRIRTRLRDFHSSSE